MADWLTILIAVLGGGGLSVAIAQNWGKIQLKRMDQAEGYRNELERRLMDLADRFDKLQDDHLKIEKEHMLMQVENQSQKRELERLNKLVKELQGYKNQTAKLARLTKALYDYYKQPDCEKLIKILDRELTK